MHCYQSLHFRAHKLITAQLSPYPLFLTYSVLFTNEINLFWPGTDTTDEQSPVVSIWDGGGTSTDAVITTLSEAPIYFSRLAVKFQLLQA